MLFNRNVIYHIIIPEENKKVEILDTFTDHDFALKKFNELKQEYQSCNCPIKNGKAKIMQLKSYKINKKELLI